MALGLPDATLPRFARHQCEECGEYIWTWLTRINPQSWTEEGFNANFVVNHEEKSIEIREGSEERVMEEFYEIALQLGLVHD